MLTIMTTTNIIINGSSLLRNQRGLPSLFQRDVGDVLETVLSLEDCAASCQYC